MVDRQWLHKLLQKHASDTRLQKYDHLKLKYPILKDKALVLAPMVDQSDLPFRLLCRNYNTNLCFTPMIHAKMFHLKEGYRQKFWDVVNGTPPEDRPLVVQLCGSEKEHLKYTVESIIQSGTVDCIDLNCGCPQTIAKRGNYGAFLLEKEDLLVDVVQFLVQEFGDKIPISVKVRILPSGLDDSFKLYKRLVDAGISMLTVHGRNRLQKGRETGAADWSAIKQVVEMFGHQIPILANGSISNLDDVCACLQETGVDGVMSSEAILEYPALFTETNVKATNGKRTGPSRLQLAREYTELGVQYPPDKGGQGNGIKCMRGHFHHIFHGDLSERIDIRKTIAYADSFDVLRTICDDIEADRKQRGLMVEDETLEWYMRHRIKKPKRCSEESGLCQTSESGKVQHDVEEPRNKVARTN